MPPNSLREEKNKQEYGLWFAVDVKYHEDSELLLTVKLDESGQILLINNIRVENLEKPILDRAIHCCVALDDRKKKSRNQSRFALVSSKPPVTAPLRLTATATRDWNEETVAKNEEKVGF